MSAYLWTDKGQLLVCVNNQVVDADEVTFTSSGAIIKAKDSVRCFGSVRPVDADKTEVPESLQDLRMSLAKALGFDPALDSEGE